jgi:hypothetical protein
MATVLSFRVNEIEGQTDHVAICAWNVQGVEGEGIRK